MLPLGSKFADPTLIYCSDNTDVYRAIDRVRCCPVVLKVLRNERASPTAMSRATHEYAILSSLDVPGVTKVYGLERHEVGLTLLLRDIGANSLYNHIKNGRLPRATCLEIACNIAEILARIHDRGVIHKDVNPHNVVYNSNTRQIELIDFGISTLLKNETIKRQPPTHLEGTLPYLAPEQTGRVHRAVDYRADLYSLGVMLYELLTGQLPCRSTEPMELVHFHVAIAPTPLTEIDTSIPTIISDIVLKLMAKTPEQRYQSAKGVQIDLAACLRQLERHDDIRPFAIAAHDTSKQFLLPQTLYGRAHERATLMRLFEHVRNGNRAVAMLSGDPGVGKTALIRSLHESLAIGGCYFVSGKYDQFQRDIPYSAIVAAFRYLVRQILGENRTRFDRWRRELQAALGSNGQVILDVIPEVERIIGPQPDAPPLQGLEAQRRFYRLFHKFISVFCGDERLLVIFLDDMQWADSASLHMLTNMMRDCEGLFIIGAYRSRDVAPTHPLVMALAAAEKSGVTMTSIALHSLKREHVQQCVAAALRRPADEVRALSDTLYNKTAGNPFFVRQMLEALYDEGIIVYDEDKRRFTWDASRLAETRMTENAVDLVTRRLQTLPPETQAALSLAAAIGNHFTLKTLSVISQQKPGELGRSLQPAVALGALLPESNLVKPDEDDVCAPPVYTHYSFAHDMIQQASYRKLASAEQPVTHLTIGRLIWTNYGEDIPDSALFDIVNHMNQGIELISSAEERYLLAELNIRAGSKAKKSTAHMTAVECFRNAIAFLGEQRWTDHYRICWDAHLAMIESSFLDGDIDDALAAIDVIAERAETELDLAQLYILRSKILNATGQLPTVVKYVRKATKLLGLPLPEDPDDIRTASQAGLARIQAEIAQRPISSFLDLPPMSGQNHIVLMEALAGCVPAAYQLNQDLLILICCQMVTLSLEYGNCPMSAYAYACLAIVATSILQQYRSAYEFAKLGLQLNQKFGHAALKPPIYYVFANFGFIWNRPIDESAEYLQRGVHHAFENGDYAHVGYCASAQTMNAFFQGAPLTSLLEQMENYRDTLTGIGEIANAQALEQRIRLIHSLQRGTEETLRRSLSNADFDEHRHLQEVTEGGNQSLLIFYDTARMIHRYLWGHFEEAHRLSLASESLLPFCAGRLVFVEHYLFSALAAAAIYEPCKDADERLRLRKRIDVKRASLRIWAEHCPENFLHCSIMVEAECQRLRGDDGEAMKSYDLAIEAARESGSYHMEGMACELAERFWSSRHKRNFAQLYRQRARAAYDAWGASALAERLRDPHEPERGVRAMELVQGTRPNTSSQSRTLRTDPLDLEALLKASQAIAREIEVERLIETLMRIVLQSAGADRGILVQANAAGTLQIHARAQGADIEVLTETPEPLGESASASGSASEAIVRYVWRSRENVLIASHNDIDSVWANDDYLRKHRPPSVLCVPIVWKSELRSVLYLENTQVAAAFTPQRLEALEVLTAQIAASMENARLFARQLEQRQEIQRANRELTRLKEHLEELVDERTAQLREAQGRMVDLSRRAGMAEVATGILHNVGNALNSIHVGIDIMQQQISKSKCGQISRVAELLQSHRDNLSDFLQHSVQGQQLLPYLTNLGTALSSENRSVLQEVQSIKEHVEHITIVISTQQEHAQGWSVEEPVALTDLLDKALEICQCDTVKDEISVVCDVTPIGQVMLDRHKVLQILVNLISNAIHAIEEQIEMRHGEQGPFCGKLRLGLQPVDDGHFAIEVEDNGVGIAAENMARIFAHGFTTRRDGHGFGLHNSANMANEMEGKLSARSDGVGMGATFVLQLPWRRAE